MPFQSRLSVSSQTSTPSLKPVESEAVKMALEKEPVVMQIPICGILAGGDRWSLHQVYASMTTNHCPFVIIRVSLLSPLNLNVDLRYD